MGFSTTPIKAKTTIAATVLTIIADAWRKAITVQNSRCAVSHDISTNWHSKMCDQNNEVTKAEEALQATSRRALTTFCTVLEAGKRFTSIVASCSADPDLHVSVRGREKYRRERGLCRAIPDANKRQRVNPGIEAVGGLTSSIPC